MSEEALKFIADQLALLGVPYSFMTWNTNPVPNPYFVGEYSEAEPFTEDGLQESTFIITGTTRGTWLTLEQAKNKIKKHFGTSEGKTAILGNKSGVAVFYAKSFPIPTGDGEFKRIQINLTVKEWSVNEWQ